MSTDLSVFEVGFSGQWVIGDTFFNGDTPYVEGPPVTLLIHASHNVTCDDSANPSFPEIINVNSTIVLICSGNGYWEVSLDAGWLSAAPSHTFIGSGYMAPGEKSLVISNQNTCVGGGADVTGGLMYGGVCTLSWE